MFFVSGFQRIAEDVKERLLSVETLNGKDFLIVLHCGRKKLESDSIFDLRKFGLKEGTQRGRCGSNVVDITCGLFRHMRHNPEDPILICLKLVEIALTAHDENNQEAHRHPNGQPKNIDQREALVL